MSTSRITLDVDGTTLVGELTGTSDTTRIALLLHGGPGGTHQGPDDLFRRLSGAFAAAGIASARFDFLGAGDSGGAYVDATPSGQVRQYRRILTELRARGYRRFGVVGESFGATCALGGYRPGDVEALVLLWLAIWLLDGTFAPFVTPARLAEAARNGCIEVDGERVGRAFLDELLADSDREAQLRSVTCPALLVHGDADSEVPVRQSARAYQVLPEPKRLVLVPGGDHCLRRPAEQDLVITTVLAWLGEHVPSGGAESGRHPAARGRRERPPTAGSPG